MDIETKIWIQVWLCFCGFNEVPSFSSIFFQTNQKNNVFYRSQIWIYLLPFGFPSFSSETLRRQNNKKFDKFIRLEIIKVVSIVPVNIIIKIYSRFNNLTKTKWIFIEHFRSIRQTVDDMSSRMTQIRCVPPWKLLGINTYYISS